MPNEPTQGGPVVGKPVEFEEAAPIVEAPPVTTETPANIQPTTAALEEPKGPSAIMGNLPNWDTVLSMNDFQSKGKGEQNQFREKWLRQMKEQNPDQDAVTMQGLRQHVYQTQHSTLDTVYGKTVQEKQVQETQAKLTEGRGPTGPVPIVPPGQTDPFGNPFEVMPDRMIDEGGGVKTIVSGETRAERVIKEGMITGNATNAQAMADQGKYLATAVKAAGPQVEKLLMRGLTMNRHDTFSDMIDPYGAIAERVEDKGGVGWYVLDSYLKAAQVMGAGTSYTIGGLEGAVRREREVARQEGRARFYSEMNPGDRIKEIERVMYSDDYVGMNEQVADLIKDEMLPRGMTVEQMDDLIVKAIADGDLPQMEFFRDGAPAPGFEKVVRDKDEVVTRNPFASMGAIFSQGFDGKQAAKSFWENVSDWDNIKIRDASTLRKLQKGKTFEEKYGFWKGLAANVMLSIIADPITWPLIMARLPAKIATKFAGSNLGKALAGRMSMRQSIEMLQDIVALDRTGIFKPTAKEQQVIDHARMIIKGFRAESEFLGKEGQKMIKLLDEADDLIGRIPTDEASRASANKVDDIINKANDGGLGVQKDEVLEGIHNIPAEGTSIGFKETPSLGTAAGRAGKFFDGYAPVPPLDEVVPDLGRAAQSTGDVIPEVARTTGAYDMSHIANSIPDASTATTRAGQASDDVAKQITKDLSKERVSTLWDGLGKEGKPRIPGVNKNGVSVLDDVAEASKKIADDAEFVFKKGVVESEEQALADANKMATAKQQEKLQEGMRTHDPKTRDELKNAFSKYEDAMDDVTTPPPAQEAMYQSLVRKWKKFHPEDGQLDEFKRQLDERRGIKAGEVVPEGTKSDLLPAPRGPVDIQATTVDEFVAKGGQVQEVAEQTAVKAPVVGKKAMVASDVKTIEQYGVELHGTGGGSQQGGIRTGGGYFGESDDTLKAAASDAQTQVLAGRTNKAQIMKDVEKQFGKPMSKGEKDTLKQVVDEVVEGKKSPGEVDQMVKDLYNEGVAAQKKPGAKIQTHEQRVAARDLKRAQDKARRPRETQDTMTKHADGTYSITKTVAGKKKTLSWTPGESDGGEYMGSIFGMAQKFWDDIAERVGGTTRGAAKTANDIAEDAAGLQGRLRRNPFSIQDQFKDFPELGIAVKNIYSVIQAVEEFTLDSIKKIAKGGGMGRWSLTNKGKTLLRDGDMIDIPLLHENMKKFAKLPLDEQARLKDAMGDVDDFYEFMRKGYSDRGVDVDFKSHFKDGIVDANKKMRDKMQGLREGTVKRMGKKELKDLGIHVVDEGFNPNDRALIGRLLKDHLRYNEQVLGEIKDFKYINIPYAMWFEQSFDKAAAVKAFKIANAQKRETFRIQDLIDSEAIERSQVNLFDMMAAYGRRAAHDFGMLDVKNTMRKGGQLITTQDLKLMSKSEQGAMIRKLRAQGWKRADPRMFPMFDRGYLHPAMSEWLNELKITGLNANGFDRFLSTVKGFQFANPFFLPLYDMQQAAAARGMLGMFNLKAWGEDMLWAAKLMKNKPQEYWDILHYGQQSQPMALPYDEYMSKISGLKETNAGSYLWNMIKKHKFKGVYNVSWDSAWNMDKFVRFTTTRNSMRKLGMNMKEAAQHSSMIHSDYGNVPVKFRRAANRFMFTPTFKITMFRSYGHMVKNMVKVPVRTLQGRGAELTQTEKAMAKAGTGLLSILVGLDLFMTGKGYERDQFARRYYKNVEIDGRMQEDVAVFASPLNMVPKYMYKASKVFNEGYKDDKLGALWSTFKWDAQPVYRIAVDLMNNKKANGDPIYEPYMDSDTMRNLKMGAYATEQVFQIIKTIGLIEKPEDQQQAWDLYRKDMGNIWSYTTKPNSFQYLREPSARRYIKKVKKMQREYKRIVMDQLEDGRFDEVRARRGQAEMMKRAKAMVDLARKAETVNDRSWLDRMKGGMVR